MVSMSRLTEPSARIFSVALCLLSCALGSAFAQSNLTFYVSPAGNDANVGTAQAPFASLEAARDAIRAARSGALSNAAATIRVEDGTFYRTQTFQLSAADANLNIRAEPTASPRLCGGARLDPAWFSVVPSNSPVWSRLDPAAQGVVVQADLAGQGITNLGALRLRGMVGLSATDPGPFTSELFCNDQPLVLARWPNAGSWATLTATTGTNLFTYSGTRPTRWLNAPDVWYHGYWYYLWADFTLPGVSINTNTSVITMSQAPRSYGIRSGQPWFAFNLLEEIDTPGEYYIDRARQVLYLWPPANFATADLFLSQLDSPLISVTGATNIVFDGLELSGGRGDLLSIDSACLNVEFRNGRLIGAGRDGAVLNGTSNRVTACELAFSGDYGVVLSGGSRPTLALGGNTVRNCRIHDFSRLSFTYTPAVQFNGAGQWAIHNQIFSAPHAAMLFSGNEHQIAFNEIYNVCQWTSDAGAVYSGRDWGFRGNRLQDNFIHDISSGFPGSTAHAFYMDDCVSGIEISSNVVYRVQNDALFNGGGRDNFYFNNVVARCGTFHYGDARGTSSIVTNSGNAWNLLQKIEAMNYQQPLWSNAYPALAAIPDNYSLLGPYKPPGGVIFSRNIGWTNTTAFTQGGSAFSYYAQWTNNITNSNPLFVDEANLDLTLQSNSPAFTIPGFGAIPFLAIGVGLPSITNAQVTLAPPGFATAQAWIDPKLDSNCVVQFFYGAVDCGRTSDGWDHVVSTNLPVRGWVAFQVPVAATQPFAGRFHAVNGEGESWSGAFLAFASVLTWDNGSGNGLWDTASTNWSGPALWNNAAPACAVFGPAGAGPVTLAAPITASGLVFNSAGYNVSGGTLTLAGTGPAITNNADSTFSSVLAGTAGLAKTGPGTLTLTGASTYTGNTTISGGTLLVNGSLSAGSAVAVDSGATLGGTVAVSGCVSPGSAPGVGALATGAETWNGGGCYLCELNSTNSAGADQLNLSGALTVAASSGNPFTIKLASLLPGNQPGWLAGFDPSRNYAWPIVTASGGLGGFTPATVWLDTSGFSNLFTGSFTLTNAGNSLLLNYAGLPVAPVIGSRALLPDGSFQLTFSGPPGQTFSVRGTNFLPAPLATWPPLTNGAIGQNGSVTFTDPAAATNSQQFYRISSP
jgi:autotransporter-associated beta strand protein